MFARRWMERPTGAGLKGVATALIACAVLGPGVASAQRAVGNTGFEEPVLAVSSGDCWLQLGSQQVPWWRTSHSVMLGRSTCDEPVPDRGPLIEIWRIKDAAREGDQFAEINAEMNSRLSQPLCLATGEVVRWQLSHRARKGVDTMSVNIDALANEVMRASTDTFGAGNVLSCGGGLVTDASCRLEGVTSVWADYAGQFTWTGSTGLHTLGFQSISTGSGSLANGNFLDRIQVFLDPYVEFSTTSLSVSEASGSLEVALRVSGVVEQDLPVAIAVDVAGSTAARGEDYDTPGSSDLFEVVVPAGDYSGGIDIPVTLPILDDRVLEDGETIVLRLREDGPYQVASTEVGTCGNPPNAVMTIALSSDDVWLSVEKTALPRADAGIAVFEVVYRNRSPVPTVGDPLAHDAILTLADDLATGYTDYAWTCTAEGSPAAACPEASGTGAFYRTVQLPPAGALRYRILATEERAGCSAQNEGWIYLVMPSVEATSVDPRLGLPDPIGEEDNTARAGDERKCADLRLTKTNTPGQAGDVDRDDDVLMAGEPTTYALVVSNGGPADVEGAVVTDPVAPGLQCTTATCTAVGDAACPAESGGALVAALQGSGAVIPRLTAESSVRIEVTCTVEAVP